jgi:hypothetical protein
MYNLNNNEGKKNNSVVTAVTRKTANGKRRGVGGPG